MIVNIHEITSQVIHCHVYCTIRKEYCFVSNIYASNLHSERVELFSSLTRVKQSMMVIPWLLMGDFNVILKTEEKSDYEEGMILSTEERTFADCFNQLEVEDYSIAGPIYTIVK